jgi:hypothetical protein
MGERTTGLDDPAVLELQIDSIRRNLTGIVRELDHRRHDLTDVKMQIDKHKPELLAAAGTVAVVAGVVGAVAFIVSRRNKKLSVRATHMRKAIGRIIEDPNRLARREPSIWKKIATGIVTAALGAAVKQVTSIAIAEVRGKPKELEPWQQLNPEEAR